MKNQFLLALNFAEEKHKFQKRKGSDVPYFDHILKVVQVLQENGADTETMIVGALHDTLEDTDTTINEIVSLFGVDIGYMVDTLSERKSLQYDERKHMQYLRIRSSTKKIKMVKCADCISNLRDCAEQMGQENFWSIFNAPKENIQKHYKETLEACAELKGEKIYSQFKEVYEKVFEEKKIQKYCTDCKFMERVLTPDTDDWFCDDDQKYVCGISGKTLSEANRPYEKQPTPSNCPILNK